MQMELGEIDISKIKFNSKYRDDVPQILRGLQQLYINEPIRKELFCVLKKVIPEKVGEINGRPGMTLWKIFVLGMLRLNLNWDYDRLQEMVNNHYQMSTNFAGGDN